MIVLYIIIPTIGQHGGNKYWFLDLIKMVYDLCHPPTILHVAQFCHIRILS